MRLPLEVTATLLTAALVASTSVPDSDDGQSVTVGASWLQKSDVVEEVVHLPDDYDKPTTRTTAVTNSTHTHNEQLSTEIRGQTFHTPVIVENPDGSKQTQVTKVQTTTTVTTNSPATSHKPPVFPVVSPSTAEFTRHALSTEDVYASRSDNSSGSAEELIDRWTSNATSDGWLPSSDVDRYDYTDETEEDIQQTDNNEIDDPSGHDVNYTQAMVENESILLLQLSLTNETFLNITGSEVVGNSSSTTVTNDSFVANMSQTQIQMAEPSTTSTFSPLSTAWLLAELPSNSDWTNDVHSVGEYVPAQRESSSSHTMMSPSSRFGPHWRLFRRLTRPARRRSGYRQMLASPYVAGGGAMTDRERKRALLHAYLLSGITGKDRSHRRAMSAAVFYRSKLAKPPAMQQDVGGAPRQTNDVVLASWSLPGTDVTASTQDSNLVDVTTRWLDSMDNSSLSWNLNSSASLNYSIWMSADNVTSNMTADDRLVSALGAQMHHTSSDRAATAAVIIPIIVGFLESLTKKQFSWLDMTLAVCGTVAVVLGLINLVVFIVHVLRTKRGKLSFHADRQLTNGHGSSSPPSSISASRSSSDSMPPPPPPAPPLPGFGGLSRSSREVSRDVLADDETLRIRPLTFKRPLNDWGFTSSHGLAETTDVAVVGQGGGVTVKSTGSDASSSGIESNGGRSDAELIRRARENSGNTAVSSSIITNYAYCGNGGVNRGIIIDVDDYRDQTCTSPSDFVFGKNYGELDTKKTKLTMPRSVTPTDDMADRKERQRSRKTQAKHRGRPVAHVGRLDASLGGGLLSRPWKRLFGVSTDVSLPR